MTVKFLIQAKVVLKHNFFVKNYSLKKIGFLAIKHKCDINTWTVYRHTIVL